jgi:myo-inositol-1(or 4)-monophosphatase
MAQACAPVFAVITSEPSPMKRVEVAIEAAKIAGAVIRRSDGVELDIQEKDSSRTSILTAVDLRSQQEVTRIIRQSFPDDLIVGEEGSDGKGTSLSRWYVDPLDGTTNYAHRLPFYCASIAYCDADGVAIGVVYDPVRNEIFTATRDGGATLNGCPIVVSANPQLRSSLLSTQVQSDDAKVLERYTSRLRRFLGVARAVRSLGAPALALAYVACGRLDAFFEADMSPWDTLAGTLLIEEAGGVVTTFAGIDRPTDHMADILATNGRLHDDILAQLAAQI